MIDTNKISETAVKDMKDNEEMRDLAKDSTLAFLRGRPDVLFAENLTSKRQKSLDSRRQEKLNNIQSNLIEVGAEELKKRRNQLIKLIQQKQLYMVSVN